jgi:hypothetical protein
MQPTSTSNIGLQVTLKSGLALSLTAVQMEELQVMMFGSLTAQDDKLMCKALTVTDGAVVKTQCGEVSVILHQYAYTGKGKTIYSSGQLEWYKQEVDDKPIKVGGKQCIKTLGGYVIPLDVKSGLPYVKMRLYTNKEWDSLPHVVLTGDGNWNPCPGP